MAAIKAIFHMSFFLLLITLCKFGHAKRNFPTHKISTSAFDAIKDLEGSGKGNTTKGISLVRAYLQRFGYLPLPNLTPQDDDDIFDDELELALKTFQQNYRIKPSGTLDSTTLSLMTSPRCGVPDIINGTNHMRPRNRKRSAPAPGPAPHQQFETVSQYTFFPGNPKWPSSQTHLTYAFLPNTPARAMDPVARAFQVWASLTNFTFSQARDNEEADLNIGFFSGDHGDGLPFDGPGGNILAHAFPPTDGRFHYDAEERWSVGAVEGEYDLETVAVHEIGHLLGLGHSQVVEAIMYPGIPAGVTKRNLHPDDIDGIRALYSV